MDENSERITVDEAAEIHQVSRMTMYRWLHAGLIPSSRTLTGGFRLKRSDVLAALPAPKVSA